MNAERKEKKKNQNISKDRMIHFNISVSIFLEKNYTFKIHLFLKICSARVRSFRKFSEVIFSVIF